MCACSESLSIKVKAEVSPYLNVAEVVSCVAAEARVDQHGVQAVHLRLALALGHEGPHVKVLWVPDVLENEKKHTHMLRGTRLTNTTSSTARVGDFTTGAPPW